MMFIIAEIGANHCGHLTRAKMLVEAAKWAGADAVKFQLYDPNEMTIDHDGPGFVLQEGPWKGQKLYDLYRKAATPIEWFPELFEHARKLGITPFSSVFDLPGLALLERLNCTMYKIASFEANDLPLVAAVAATDKPIIVSTGVANHLELERIACGLTPNLTLLHCVSEYPALTIEGNMQRMVKLREQFGVPVGLSDHTITNTLAIMSVALGGTMIEKHLILNHSHVSPDNSFSIDPDEFKTMVLSVRHAHIAMKQDRPNGTYSKLKRSVYAVKDIKKGDVISMNNVRSIRPGHGLDPKLLPEILGQVARVDVPRGTPFALEYVA